MEKVYPRVYGGTNMMVNNPNPESGLSPRVRGNLTTFLVVIKK